MYWHYAAKYFYHSHPHTPTFDWDAFSAIVLAVTAILIYQQVKEARNSSRFLEQSIRPSAWFFLRSAKARRNRGEVVGDDRETMFVVKNESKQKILMYVTVVLSSGDRKVTKRLEDPLHIYPGGSKELIMQFPNVVRLDEFSAHDAITADIHYSIAPSHAPNEKQEGLPETWRFETGEWVGPNGIQSSFINV